MRTGVLIAPLFEDVELAYPFYRLQEAGHEVALVGSEARAYRGKRGIEMEADVAVADTDAAEFDGLVIPGGYAPDHMRRDSDLVDLVAAVGSAGKPVGAICHAPWMLASAGLADGRRLTSYPSIRDDLVNAGADWVDEEAVVDGNVVTSRRPADLPAFMVAFLDLLKRPKEEAA